MPFMDDFGQKNAFFGLRPLAKQSTYNFILPSQNFLNKFKHLLKRTKNQKLSNKKKLKFAQKKVETQQKVTSFSLKRRKLFI